MQKQRVFDLIAKKMPATLQAAPGPFGPVILVILLGLAVRLFVFFNTAIINPDGALYIHQARALYFGFYGNATTCGIPYVSIYPVFIALIYPLFGDWATAAKSVSLFFGTATLIPLYFLIRRFFVVEISVLVLLSYSLIPVLVDRSVDILRDPAYWFFLVLGLWLFCTYIDRKKYSLLAFSCVVFLVATSLRIEGVLCLIVACVYIIVGERNDRPKKIFLFLAPLILIAVIAVGGQLLFSSSEINWYRLKEIPERLGLVGISYQELRAGLQALVEKPPHNIPFQFFDDARSLVWFIALGTILQGASEAFFYPFFLLFLVGLVPAWRQGRSDKRVLYCLLACFLAFWLLYLNLLTYWVIENRYFAILLFPACVVLGFGIEKIISYLQARHRFKRYAAFAFIGFLILLATLPKNLKIREADKAVFKQIGEYIEYLEGEGNEAAVLTSSHSLRWIAFYANAHVLGAPCPDTYHLVYASIIGDTYPEFLRNLKARGIRYFLWEERHWPDKQYDFIAQVSERDFRRLGSWCHPDTGNLILFKVL